ncbi:PREDICTED: protein I'm not dead yet-like isoform X2 [Nicrophorus vespilloides]|uniref:Protein I'm not dead yet-like isoform X2 n=1 Tax=Nicrophorus vespilloides TaxID=110193 RepID=A0ABM1M6T4_NICVS|nr:PREDICTED: protein I'm not dead yet-like isoform X2 [Nicrophorus vespilloides]
MRRNVSRVIGGRISFLRSHWRGFCTTLLPVILLPIFLIGGTTSLKCLYVIILMVGYWVSESLPLPITALIPTVLFPTMDIISSDIVPICYITEGNILFMCSLMLALAIEHSQLHRRLGLGLLLAVKCRLRLFNFVLAALATFVSMWMANVSAIVVLYPILDAAFRCLQSHSTEISYFSRLEAAEETLDLSHVNLERDEEEVPSREAICTFLTCAYASTVGGISCMAADSINHNFNAIHSEKFPSVPNEVTTLKWALLNLPIALITIASLWLWLQVQYMGLFREKSNAAQRLERFTLEKVQVRAGIRDEFKDLGALTFHEIGVAGCLLLALFLWFFRQPDFLEGWSTLFTELKIQDSTCSILIVALLFMIPSKFDWRKLVSEDYEREDWDGLLTWAVVQKRMPWGLLVLVGGGNAIVEGSRSAGIGQGLVHKLRDNYHLLPKFAVLAAVCFLGSVLTELSGHIAVIDLLLPIAADIAQMARWHPLYLMIPVTIASSHAFCLPASAPTNAVVQFYCKIPTREMLLAGIAVSVIAASVILLVFPLFGAIMFGIHKENFIEYT